jgi:hypothetical protein
MRLAIGGPTRDVGPVSFAVDVAQLFAYTRERGPWGTNVTIGFLASTYIHVGRERFLEQALQLRATHVLWLDTDMSIPPYLAIQCWQSGKAIVAANYVTRQPPHVWGAIRDGEPVATLASSSGLEAVDGVGMGAFYMSVDVLAELPRPWFRHGLTSLGRDIGEDRMFCRALRQAGHEIWIDHDLSKAVSHVGQRNYDYTDATLLEVAV